MPSTLDTTDYTLAQKYYTMGRSPLIVYFHEFQQIFNYNLPISYSAATVGIPDSYGLFFINTTVYPYELSIYGTSNAYVRNTPYEVVITARVANEDSSFTEESISFNLTLLNGNTAPPYFKPSLKNLRMQATTNLRYSFPSLFDDDEGNAVGIVMASLGSASKFTTGSFPKYTFKPKTTDVGEYSITIMVSDNDPIPLSAEYNFTLYVDPANITDNTTQPNISVPTNNTSVSKVNNSQTLKANIKTISNSGLMTVVFNKAVIVPANFSAID